MKQERANASAKALKRSEKRSASNPKPLSQEKHELPVRKPFGQEDSDDDDHDEKICWLQGIAIPATRMRTIN